MAFDSEEMKKRRAQRDQERKRQQARQRKMILRLTCAAVVLALCGLVIFFVSRGGGSQPTVPTGSLSTLVPSQTVPPTPPPETTVPEATEPTTVIHLVAGGDLNVNDATVAAGGIGYSYDRVILDVAHLLADGDISVMNFEGILDGEPYGSENGSAPQQMARALSNAGIDLLQAANSRSTSNGISGLTSTLQSIRAAGMEPLGAYATSREFQESGGYTIREVSGIRIAFVAFTKGMGGMALPAGSEDCVNLLYKDYSTTYQDVDREGITSVLRTLEERESPDLVVAMLHWGSEYNDQISGTQTEIRNLLQQNGVDAIIGTHSHYVQKMEFDEASGRFVAYSLGDFFSGALRAGTEYSVILDLEITRDNTSGKTRITNYSYTPIFTTTKEDGTMRVLRIKEAMEAYENNFLDRITREEYEDMAYALTRIEARIHPDEE